MKIKTQYDLKRAVQARGTVSYFFDRNTMAFFGDTMRNYKLVDHAQYYELERRRSVKCGLRDSCFFDKDTLQVIYPSGELAE